MPSSAAGSVGMWTADALHDGSAPSQSHGFYYASASDNEETDGSPKEVGVLSRTLLRSPAIQWILPARIRHKDKNDAIFVGEDYIQISELLPHHQLEEIATKSDFGCPIRAARVFGAERKAAVSVLDQIIKKEPVDEVKGINPHSAQCLPPQILVLTLESNEMVFLFTTQGSSRNTTNFICSKRPLPNNVSYPEQYGKHLAVDPKSRAMAVGAYSNYFGIFAIKTIEQLQDEMWEDGNFHEDRFRPVMEERFFNVDGIILKMEFLSQLEGEEKTVNLVLLVSRQQTTYIYFYQWDSSTSVRNAMRTTVQPVSTDEKIPLLLIPLTKSGSFMIISETTVSTWTGIASGHATRRGMSLSNFEVEPTYSGNSRRQPLFTWWARPVRHQSYRSEHDDLYLCREDGVMLYMEIKPQASDNIMELIYQVGPLSCNIDTAFAILDPEVAGGADLILACGDMSNGGLYTVKARKRPICQQAISNWAPVLDFVAVEGADETIQNGNLAVSSTGKRPKRSRIFTCSGRGNDIGSVNELRYGLEARVGLTTEDETDFGTNQLWALPDIRENVLYLLASDPLHSYLMHISVNGDDFDAGYDEEGTGLDLSSPTLAAGSTLGGAVIQVTETSIRVTVLEEVGPRCIRQPFPDDGTAIIAAVKGELSLLVAAVRLTGGVSLICGGVMPDEDSFHVDLVPPLVMSTQPSSLCIGNIDGFTFIVVGTTDAKLQLFSITNEPRLKLLAEHSIEAGLSDSDGSACAALTIISIPSDNGAERHTLLCGLRSGVLAHFDISKTRNIGKAFPTLRQTGLYKLGDTTVSVSVDRTSLGAAFVTCGLDFWRLTYDNDPTTTRYMIESIYLTDLNEPYFQQGMIFAHVRVDMFPYLGNGGLAGALICVHNRQMAISSLDSIAKVVTRRIEIGGTPNRIIYVKHLNKLVVSYSKIQVKTKKRSQNPRVISKRRWIRPTLKIIDPDKNPVEEPSDEENEEALGESTSRRFTMPVGKAGERVLALLEWNLSNGLSTYSLIVVATMVQHNNDSPSGRLLTFSLKAHGTNVLDIAIKSTSRTKEDHPIWSVAAWGEDALIYCAGSKLIMRRFNFEEMKLLRVAEYEMNSPALAISTLDSLIYVTTMSHSSSVFKFENEEIIPHAHDAVSRSGQHHINLGDSLFMVAIRAWTVIGFATPLPSRNIVSTPLLFQAQLHTSVTRLRDALIRPTWMVDRRVVLGSATNGTMYQFTILNKQEQLLLRFVQNLTKRDPQICPFRLRHAPLGKIDPTGNRKPLALHVDGDMLSRLVDRGTNYLRNMLTKEPEESSQGGDFESGEARLSRFEELAESVVGEVDNPVAVVMEWMRNHLQLVL